MYTTFEEFEAMKGTYEMAARTSARQRAERDAIAAEEGARRERRARDARPRWVMPRVRMPHWPRVAGRATA